MMGMPTDVDAVVFDCDGLLVETEAAWTLAEPPSSANMDTTSGQSKNRSSSVAPWPPAARQWPGTSARRALARHSRPGWPVLYGRNLPLAPQPCRALVTWR
jgi:hypothetical protein